MKSEESRIRDVPLDEIDRSRNHRLPRLGDAERLEAIMSRGGLEPASAGRVKTSQ